jgi:hypothetical protein
VKHFECGRSSIEWFAPEGVVSTRERFYKIEQDTFRNFDSNVIDTNIKL